MDTLWQDIRVSLRGLRKDRAFTLTTVATLALCLAANTAIFAVVNGVLLKPLPFPEPSDILTIFNAYPGAGVRWPQTACRTTTIVSSPSPRSRSSRCIARPASPSADRSRAGRARSPACRSRRRSSASCAWMPYRGRVFTEEEAEPGQDRKVVLSYGFWQRASAAGTRPSARRFASTACRCRSSA